MILLVLMPAFCVTRAFGEVSKNEAASSLTDARGAVDSAFQAVLQAEKSGANVSVLLGRLNEAGWNLTLAHYAYEQGDFDKAVALSNSSKNVGVEVQSAAVELKASTFSENVQHLWVTMIGSLLGVCVVSLGGFSVWHFLRRRYGASQNE
jgi:hypothetical protein